MIDGIDNLTEIGRGGFAIVYRGHQAAFRRDVAVKVLTRTGLDADDRRRFERECQAMGLLSDHPGIVTLYDAGFTDDGRPFMVMAHVGGGSLADHLDANGAMSWQDVTRLGVRLCGALETAHRADVLHRDIKPANVLRSDYGEQLSDFGIARIAGGHETRSGVITASLAHVSPEILDGSKPTIAADVYSLGSTLFEAAMGHAAFVRDTDESLVPLIRRVVIDPVPDMVDGGIPSHLARVIETAMAKDAAARFSTAEAFGHALRGAQASLGVTPSELAIVGSATIEPATAVIVPPGAPASNQPPSSTPPTTTAPPTPPPQHPPAGQVPDASADGSPARRSNRTLVAFAIVGVLAAAAAAGVFLLNGDDTPDGPPTAIPVPSTTTAADATPSTSAPATSAPSTAPPAISATGPVAVLVENQFRGQLQPALAAAVETLESNFSLTAELETVDITDFEGALSEFARRGNNPVIAFGVSSTDAVAKAAELFGETTFVVVDGDTSSSALSGPNIVHVSFATHESAFIAGAAAARATRTGRVAFIGGSDDERSQQYEAGYVAGVRTIDVTTQIDVRYLGTDSGAPAGARELANRTIALGADVIYQVTGSAGSGVLEAAAVAGSVWMIGSDIDWYQAADANQQPFVLTSTLKNYNAAFAGAVISADDGSLSPGGITIGLADGGIDFSINGGFLTSILAELQAIGGDIVSGALTAPATVAARAIAPLDAACPTSGCDIRILGAVVSGGEVVVSLEANWVMAEFGDHAHFYWSPNYSAEQVGGDSSERFGVTVGSWDLDARYPVYVTENGASLALRGSATDMCVTPADRNHNVIDPTVVSCISVVEALG